MSGFSFQTKLPMLFWLTSNGDGLGEGTGSGKMPPFSISGMLIQLFIFQEVTLTNEPNNMKFLAYLVG